MRKIFLYVFVERPKCNRVNKHRYRHKNDGHLALAKKRLSDEDDGLCIIADCLFALSVLKLKQRLFGPIQWMG